MISKSMWTCRWVAGLLALGLAMADRPARRSIQIKAPASGSGSASDIKQESEGVWSIAVPCDNGFCQVGDRFGFDFRGGSAHLVDFSQCRGMTAYGLTNGVCCSEFFNPGKGDEVAFFQPNEVSVRRANTRENAI